MSDPRNAIVSPYSIVILRISLEFKQEYKLITYYVCCSDMAIGCPYGGDDQQGLVFIYNGDIGGLRDAPTQTLSGQWASSSFPSSFGFALRGDSDLDQNGYPGNAANDAQSGTF